MPSNFNRSRDGMVTNRGVEVYGRNTHDTTQATGIVFRTNAETLTVNGVQMTAERFVWLRQVGILLDATTDGSAITAKLTESGRKAWPFVQTHNWQNVLDAVRMHYAAMPYQTPAVQNRLSELDAMTVNANA